MTMALILDHISFLNLLRADDFDFLIGHVIVVLVSLHLVWLITWSCDSRARRRDRLCCGGSLSSRGRVTSLTKCSTGFDLRDLNFLDLLRAATVAGEVLTSRLVTSLVDIGYFFAAALGLITDIRICVPILVGVIGGTATTGCSLVRLLNVHDQFFLFRSGVLRQSNLLLRDNIDLTLVYHSWLISLFLLLVMRLLLLWLDLWRTYRVQVIRHESIGELVPSNCHGQQVWDPIGEEWLLEDFAHWWPLSWLFDEHVGDRTFQILRVRVRDGWIIAAQDFEHETFHRIRIKCMS